MKQPTQCTDIYIFSLLTYINYIHWDYHDVVLTYFLFVSPFDPHLSWQLNLGIHFCICSVHPLVLSVLLFSFVVRTKLKEWGASLKGRPRSLPPGLLHQRWQKAVWTIGKCFIGHDTLCSRVRATLNFSLAPSLLHFYCPARLLTNLQPRVHQRVKQLRMFPSINVIPWVSEM